MALISLYLLHSFASHHTFMDSQEKLDWYKAHYKIEYPYNLEGDQVHDWDIAETDEEIIQAWYKKEVGKYYVKYDEKSDTIDVYTLED